MRITEAKYVRKYNLGNYESEDYGLTAVIEDDETAQSVLNNLKAEVAAAYSGEAAPEPAASGKKKKGKKKPPQDSEDAPDADDVEATEAEEEETEAEETEEENEEEDDRATPIDGATGKRSTKKKFVKKPEVYQRGKETHRELFSSVLKTAAPDWKKSDKSKEKAKDVSTKMEGKAFLNEDGDVLESFKVEVKKLMGKK